MTLRLLLFFRTGRPHMQPQSRLRASQSHRSPLRFASPLAMYSRLNIPGVHFLTALDNSIRDGGPSVPRTKKHILLTAHTARMIVAAARIITFDALAHALGRRVPGCALHCFPASADHAHNNYKNHKHPNAQWNPTSGHSPSVNYLYFITGRGLPTQKHTDRSVSMFVVCASNS